MATTTLPSMWAALSGHARLFQYHAEFAADVEAFLAGAA